MKTFDITEFDLFLLSYDEPNANENWSRLLEIAPWAERIHGVKGFDAAHKAAANASSTDWFITVDADNVVRPEFFNLKIDLDVDATPNRCFSWNAENKINGLMYGNGGLKLWSKQFVMNMLTHENAKDSQTSVDFCWETDYVQKPETYSDVYNNGSPYQAYRVGFREGVKLSLDRGHRIMPSDMTSKLHPLNMRNLRIWGSVGADVENGVWAMYGLRNGLMHMCNMTWDHTKIIDYAWFDEHWKTAGFDNIIDPNSELYDRMDEMGDDIFKQTKIYMPLLGQRESSFFRETYALRNI